MGKRLKEGPISSTCLDGLPISWGEFAKAKQRDRKQNKTAREIPTLLEQHVPYLQLNVTSAATSKLLLVALGLSNHISQGVFTFQKISHLSVMTQNGKIGA